MLYIPNELRAKFDQWAKDRKEAYDNKFAAIDRMKRIEALRAKKKELAEKEELYFAFEKYVDGDF